MVRQTIQLAEQEAQFLNAYANHGFSSIDQLISKALHLLKKDLEHQQQLLQSADLYAEVYEEDEETRSWTEGLPTRELLQPHKSSQKIKISN